MRQFLFMAALAAAMVPPGPVLAQMVCGEHDKIVKMLSAQYKEERIAAAIITGGTALLEVFTSELGTWTMLITPPGKPSCIVSAGDNWQGFEKKKPEAML